MLKFLLVCQKANGNPPAGEDNRQKAQPNFSPNVVVGDPDYSLTIETLSKIRPSTMFLTLKTLYFEFVSDLGFSILGLKLPDNSLCNKNLSSFVCILSSVLCRLPLYICQESSTNQLFLCKTNPISKTPK